MNKLDTLYIELNNVLFMTEEQVCRKYNADSKDEYIALIQEEISEMEEDFSYEDDSGMDYPVLLVSQGLTGGMDFIKF